MEGIHAKVTQSLLGGRPLSPAGLGLELKWPNVEEILQSSPQARACSEFLIFATGLVFEFWI